MRPVFEALGFSVGAVIATTSRNDRQNAYRCDVTYGTAREFGFDFLRDRLQTRHGAENRLLFLGANAGESDRSAPPGRPPSSRDLNFAIIDEADSLLIDEARIPLIISARSSDDGAAERNAYRWSRTGRCGIYPWEEHFTSDPIHKKVGRSPRQGGNSNT